MEYKGEKPQPGDYLTRLGEADSETRNFLQFSRQVFDLRNKQLPIGGSVYLNADPTEVANAPWMVEEPNGNRWVAVDVERPGRAEPLHSYVLIQPLPLGEVLLSFVWFTLQLGVFVFAALAYWNRPYDQASRLFLAMCIVTLGAYVGGFHWWVVSGRLWLTLPFGICATLLPAVALHFFLVFPRQKSFVTPWSLAAIYAVPVVTAAGLTLLQIYLHSIANDGQQLLTTRKWLGILRSGIYVYLVIAAVYFLGMVAAVFDSLKRAGNPMERGQLQWIWWAALAAAGCVGYSVFLAIFDRHSFALGGARVPMFLASLAFMSAYTVGIVRYRLIIVDQIVGKGALYYLFTVALAVAFGMVVAMGTFAPAILNISLTQRQALLIAVLFLIGVLLLLWMRDMIQHGIDRQFFREKYQLDKALERVNRAVGHMGDPEAIAGMMIASCRDILDVRHAALYLRAESRDAFQLVAVEGTGTLPIHLPRNAPLMESLRDSVQSIGTTSNASGVQDLLLQMRAELVHTLESGTEIIGLVFLGKKVNSTAFTAEDLTFLNALGQITNVALHGARMHHAINRLNEDLRLKTEKISDQRRQIALLQSELTTAQPIDALPDQDGDDFQREAIKGNSAALREVLESVRKVARAEATVLIYGESGTGKELLAQVLHENGPRRSGPMIRVHCASLAPTLLESELFGHVKGAFTGAHRDRPGRFQLADGGTLFLDEIGEISGETQVKLLRVLQERRFEPVGGTETVSVDVRVIAATNRDLAHLIAEGKFREDLYYRLNVVSLTLPPLRERSDDVYELALHFLNRAAQRAGRRVGYIEDDALAALERYAWPGNVRELENVIERAVVMCEDNRITIDELPPHVRNHGSGSAPRARHGSRPSPRPTHEPGPIAASTLDSNNGERDLLLAALRDAGGNKAEAARQLGLARSTYYSKLKKHGIE